MEEEFEIAWTQIFVCPNVIEDKKSPFWDAAIFAAEIAVEMTNLGY